MDTKVEVRCSECGDWILDSDSPKILCYRCAYDHETALSETGELRDNLEDAENERVNALERADTYRALLEDLIITKRDQNIPGYVFLDNKQLCCCFCLMHWEPGDLEQHDRECPVWVAQEELGI